MKRFGIAVIVVLFCLGFALAGRSAGASSSASDSDSDRDCLDSVEPKKPTKKPTCTGKGEKYLECGEYQYCDPVCNRLDEPCNKRYFQCPFGCQCPQGYAYKEGTRDCVKIKDCPKDVKKCKKNMVWSDCANACTDSCNRHFMKCSSKCAPRCICDIENGFALDKNGNCVQWSTCGGPKIQLE